MKFPKVYSLSHIADLINSKFIGSEDFPISGINEIHVVEKGDIVFEEGMIADGFYIVKEGEFENTYKRTKNRKIFKKKYKKGSHFGSRVLLEGGKRTGTIRAKTDSLVLRIDTSSFKLLTENLPVLRDYFGEYLPRTFKKLNLEDNN